MFFLLLFLNQNIQAQILSPQIIFFKDSLKVGENIQVSLVFTHPADMDVLFPDSSFNFTPFEYVNKKYFPTKTIDKKSKDSVIYTLTTYEINKVFSLSLPVYVLVKGDTDAIFSKPDSIHLTEVVHTIPNPVKLKSNTSYSKVAGEFNVFYWSIALGFFLISSIITWLFFGKKIHRRWLIYVMKRRHKKFISTYESRVSQSVKSFSENEIESCLVLWKDYLSRLEKLPVYTYSTKDVHKFYKNEELKISLAMLDKCIYGNFDKIQVNKFGVNMTEMKLSAFDKVDGNQLDKHLRFLQNFTEERMVFRIKNLYEKKSLLY